MRISVFLITLLVSGLAATVLGILAGFKAITLVLFVIAVIVAVQLAYLGLIALRVAERKHEVSQSGKVTRKASSKHASSESDL